MKNILSKTVDVMLWLLDWTWCFVQNLVGYILSRYWLDNLAPAEGFGPNLIPWIKEHEAKWRVKIYLVTPKSKAEHWFLKYISGFGCGRYVCLQDAIPDNGKVDDEENVSHEFGHVVTGRIIGILFIFVMIFSPIYNLIGRRKIKNGMTWFEMAKWYYSRWCERLADFFGKVNRKAWLSNYMR